MPANLQPTLAISSWSIHRALGIKYPNAPERDTDEPAEPFWGAGNMSLLDMPEKVAEMGIDRIEFCHFHLPGRDKDTIAELRAAMADAGVTLQAMLIDAGDITHPDPAIRQRDLAWIKRWIDVSVELGAERARVSAGRQKPSPEVLDRSIAGLAEAGRYGDSVGMPIITENWQETLEGPEEVHTVLDGLDGKVGYLADFGNWNWRPTKYADLESVLPRAVGAHATATFDANLAMDGDDYARCYAAVKASGFGGYHTLIYAGPNDDEWAALAEMRDFIRRDLARAAA